MVYSTPELRNVGPANTVILGALAKTRENPNGPVPPTIDFEEDAVGQGTEYSLEPEQGW